MAPQEILVVDDTEDVRLTVSYLLSLEGYLVRTASNGVEALRLIDPDSPPALVLLDLMMPVMDGWSVLSHLQASAYRSLVSLPVVVMSAVNDELADDVKALFHVAVVRKPFDTEVLLTTVRLHVDRSAD